MSNYPRTIRSIKQIASHRNGVGGEGFHAVLFTAREGNRHMVATVFEAPGHVSVLEVPMLSMKEGVTFGLNSWAGDTFERELREAISKWEAKREAELSLMADRGDDTPPVVRGL